MYVLSRNDCKQKKCSFFTAEQEGRSVVPHVECYPLLRDWLLSGAYHGAGYMLVLHVVLVHSRKRLVAKRRLPWRRIYASVACGACSFAVAKTWNSDGPIPPSRCLIFMLCFYHRHMSAWLFHPAFMLSSCT